MASVQTLYVLFGFPCENCNFTEVKHRSYAKYELPDWRITGIYSQSI